MGTALSSLDVPITRQFNAITVYNEKEEEAGPCIKCGRCLNACPMNLFPASAERVLKIGTAEAIESLHPEYCMGCASCSFVCPAKKPLAQAMSLAKLKSKELNKK